MSTIPPRSVNVRKPRTGDSSSAGIPARQNKGESSSAPSVPPAVNDAVGAEAKPKASAHPSRFMRVVHTVFGVTLALALGTGVVVGARRYVRTSPRFVVTEIVTAGGKHRTPDDLANIAGVAKGQNIFSIDIEHTRARLAADPWIETAQVSRQLPGTITMRVTEREAAAVLVAKATEGPAATDGTYLVTRDGSILKRVEAGDPVDGHIVTGVSIQALVDDREGATRTIRRALDLASEYDRSPLAQRSPLEEIHVEMNGDLTLVVGKTTVTIRMGAPPYRRKLEQAVRVIGELDRRGAKPDIIMLDDEAREGRVVVRMR